MFGLSLRKMLLSLNGDYDLGLVKGPVSVERASQIKMQLLWRQYSFLIRWGLRSNFS